MSTSTSPSGPPIARAAARIRALQSDQQDQDLRDPLREAAGLLDRLPELAAER